MYGFLKIVKMFGFSCSLHLVTDMLVIFLLFGIHHVHSDGEQVSDFVPQCKIIRQIQNKGFHRNLVSKLTLENIGTLRGSCEVLLIENFPKGVYVDVDQLDFQNNKDDIKVYSPQDAEVETPAYLASNQEVYQWGILKQDKDKVEGLLILPIHLRYQNVSDDETTVIVRVKVPKVLMHCEAGVRQFETLQGENVFASCDNKDVTNVCEWREINCIRKEEVLKMHVPVGERHHYIFVLYVTVLLCGFYTLLLIFQTFRQKEKAD